MPTCVANRSVSIGSLCAGFDQDLSRISHAMGHHLLGIVLKRIVNPHARNVERIRRALVKTDTVAGRRQIFANDRNRQLPTKEGIKISIE